MNTNGLNHTDAQEPILIERNTTSARFLKTVNHISRQNMRLCWHCWTCGGGCPVSHHMDFLPNQAIRLIQLGRKEEVLRSKVIWQCIGCHTCSCQCPNGVDIAAIMDALRQLSIREGFADPNNDALRFHKSAYESIRRSGRLNKLEVMMRYKLRTGNFFSDLGDGIRMLMRGKLELYGKRVRKKHELDAIFKHYEDSRRSFSTHE